MHRLIEENKQQLFDICRRHFVKKLYVFGSITGKYFQNTSDIDLLYEIDTDNFPDWATGDYDYTDNILNLEEALKKLFNRSIDLVPDIYFQNKFFKRHIESSKQLIYAA